MGPARGQALATEPWSGPVTSARTVRPSPTSAAWTWSGEEYRRPTRQCDRPAPSHSTAPRQTLCRPPAGVGVVDRPSRHSTCVPARRRWPSDATRRRAHTCPASGDVPRGAQSAMLRQRVDLFRPFRPRRGPHRRPSRVRPADGPRARLEPGRGPPHALAPRHSRAWALADSDLRGHPISASRSSSSGPSPSPRCPAVR